MSLCWGTSAYVLRSKFVPRISVKCKMLRITCEHKPTNMQSNKDFQLSSLVLFLIKKVTKPDFISPFSSRCNAKRFFSEDFKFLTNVCHKNDGLHIDEKNCWTLDKPMASLPTCPLELVVLDGYLVQSC